ncbi:MAG: hypothetical protein IK118_07630 [Clostridia bacterium]|nr:hypothetical protein [Clostridia bacterium]
MATKWKNYKGAPRAIAVLLAIVSAFSATYCGFFAFRDELLYDFDNSAAYYNTMFFESAVQKRMTEIVAYAQGNSRETLTLSAEDEAKLCAELRDALTDVCDALSVRCAAFGFGGDLFDGCASAGDYCEALFARRPELQDGSVERLFYEYYEPYAFVTESQARICELTASGNYRFTAVIGGDRFTLPAQDITYFYHSSMNGAAPTSVPETTVPGQTVPAADDAHATTVETTMVTARQLSPTTLAPTVLAPTEPTAVPMEPTAARTTSVYEAYGENGAVPVTETTSARQGYDEDGEIARWLAECCSLRTFLLDSVRTTDRAELLAAAFSVEKAPSGYGAYAEDIADDSLAQYLFCYPETGEYITNIAEYKQKSDEPMYSSAQIGEIRAAVVARARKAEWFVVVTPDGAEHNIGNGTEGQSSLRREALGYSRMSACTDEIQATGGELYLFGDGKAHESDIFSYIAGDFQKAKSRRAVMIGGTALGVAVFLISAVYILIFGTKAPVGIDRLYNDWHFLVSAGLAGAGGYFGIVLLGQVIETYGLLGFRYGKGYMNEYTWDLTAMELLTPPVFAAAVLVLLEYLVSVIRNGRNGTLIRRSFWFALPSFVVRQVKKQRAGVPNHYKKQFYVVLVGGITLILIFWIAELAISDYIESGAFLFACFLASAAAIALLVLVLRHIRGIDAIAEAAERIRNGDLTAEIDMTKLPRHLRPMADSVMRNRDGIRDAVEQSVKDERMKTALITNVSHDLKTPLTSIITYSDLLSKRELADEDAKKYVGVINEKAIKLKRLIEDLVEASKASTGNIKIEKVKLNLCEITAQAVGEYADELEKLRLETVVTCPEEGVSVSADSRQTWRIIENLLSNVKKYAMQGTRVYIDVRRQDGFGVFEIKNVSALPLNIPARELTQRFVRGDASRTTEGSGLGLSIARSLCELQGGRFEIAIDGDLFKVCVALPLEALSDKG